MSELLMSADIEQVWIEWTSATKDAAACSARASAAVCKITSAMGLCPSPVDTADQRLAWNHFILAQAAHGVASVRLATATAAMVRMVSNEQEACAVVAFAATRGQIH